MEAANSSEGVPIQGRQFLFPGINFTSAGSVTRWTFVATASGAMQTLPLPQLQVWRENPFVRNSFLLMNSTGEQAELQGNGPLYHYVPTSPISVMPGDLFGMFIPQGTSLLPRFRDVGIGNAIQYYTLAVGGNAQIRFIRTDSVSVNEEDRYIPLVAVEFGEDLLMSSNVLF